MIMLIKHSLIKHSLIKHSYLKMANSSGSSRIYGGIHIESSNKAGLYLGSLIGHNIWLSLKDI